MNFEQLVKKAIEIRVKYSKLERKKFGKEWSKEHVAQGLVGDVGDLMKLVMAKEGIRKIDDVDKKLAHELSDCLWAILVLANEYKVDLESSFLQTMDELEKKIDSEI